VNIYYIKAVQLIQETNLTEQTVKNILEMIEKSSLREGDFFATESELEEKFQISRPVLREALSRIRALGFLESRKRKGLIVSKPDPINLFGTGGRVCRQYITG